MVLTRCFDYISAQTSGTTVTFMIIEGRVLTVASVGDSRCILESAEGEIYYLSADHRLECSVEERERITASGGEVGRLNTGGGTECPLSASGTSPLASLLTALSATPKMSSLSLSPSIIAKSSMLPETALSSCGTLWKLQAEQASDVFGTLTHKIQLLKKQIQADRVVSVREKLEENRKNLEGHVSLFLSVATSRNDVSVMEANGQGKMLSSRIKTPPCKFSGFAQGSGDKDYTIIHEVVFSTSVNFPHIDKIPPYTTWIFLDRFDSV
ncbi:putative protein phosphatase 2C 12 [Camellia lanceoleosa]|uniref:Uncharacterized protein n=1 Tax=Camellia lanceoleosa TaxID=1840588 RepID=A0ACC0IMX5_9ERIC|nr:putative protein phosphatase 2C 12 [Camellia lanceoleosa]